MVSRSQNGTWRQTVWLPAVLAGLWLSGCAASQSGTAVGGLAARDGERVSGLVAQGRAQAAELSAAGFRYGARETKEAAPALEMALTGDGVGFGRGLQVAGRDKARLRLYVDKATYARGEARIALGTGEEQVWPIVAFEQRGRADRDFEFTFLLTDPGGAVRYLVLLGGSYEESGAGYFTLEGILVVPGAGGRLDAWERLYKFDFGLKSPARPAYTEQVAQAESLFRDVDRAVSQLEVLKERIAKAEAEAGEARRAAQGGTPRRGPDPAALEERAREAKDELAGRAADAEGVALRYYTARRTADDEFAAFAASNRYTWRDREGQSEAYRRWQTVEFHHPRIDELVKRLLPFLADTRKLQVARAEAMAVFARNNNWDKNPEPKAGDKKP